MRNTKKVLTNHHKDKTMRNDPRFYDEIQEIKNDRLKNGVDKTKKSDRRLTSLIPRYNGWEKIKKLMKLHNFNELSPMNKRGQLIVGDLFEFIIWSFLIILFIGTLIYAFNTITTSLLEVTVNAGEGVNFTNITLSTFGEMNTAILKHANLIAIMILLGMSLSMIFLAYLTRDRSFKILFVFDLLILIFAYILSTYIANTYETTLNSIPFSSIFTNNLNTATTFLLKLPLMVSVLGVVIMIISYAGIPRGRQDVAGF